MPTYLVTHTDPKGHNIACANVQAPREVVAVKRFEALYPLRKISVVGVLGDPGQDQS